MHLCTHMYTHTHGYAHETCAHYLTKASFNVSRWDLCLFLVTDMPPVLDEARIPPSLSPRS